MIDSFIAYLEHLELLTFFSGYPILYAFVKVVAGNQQKKESVIAILAKSLPIAYALVGTIFLFVWFRELYIQSGIKNLEPGFNISPLKCWGLLSVLFWLPMLRRRSIYSLAHSLVFFFLLSKDLATGLGSQSGKDIISNDMKVYTVSIILNLFCLLLVWLVSILFKIAHR
jgi:hypothetical protein